VVLGVVAVGGLTTGVVSSLQVRSLQTEVETAKIGQLSGPRLQQQQEKAQRFETLQWLGYGVGAAAAAGAVVCLILDQKEGSADRVARVRVIGSHRAGRPAGCGAGRTVLMRAWCLLAAAFLGCKYQPKIRAGVIACDPGGVACPAPYVCVVKAEGDPHGLCDLPSADAGVVPPAPDAKAPPRDTGADVAVVDAAADQAPPADLAADLSVPAEGRARSCLTPPPIWRPTRSSARRGRGPP
jgi:hypothetical protein